ncbi:M1 family metallopeptidase [Actinoplanes awajinensis]|uniref:Aminopeptidase N n=1 Tax=Actinoplanes awajinensis subsp. mycoplanecinus TaxID=135947 RepID=A0A117MN75_9ACTN|nr:M1 family metallopeptidase [Actinoplanes awajinensis]KUL26697.1 metallopeptidase [Actinoplanes awajinensis subsp. mycoplanecinus]
MSDLIEKRLSTLLAAGVTALLAVAGTAVPAYAGGGPATPGSAGLGDRLYPLLGNGGYDVQDYDLRIRYPEKDPKQTVTGDVTITAVATQNLSRFDLDFGGDAVGTVAVNGRPATFSRSGDELVVTPARDLHKGKRFWVTVSGFTATPIPANADSPAGFVTTPDGTIMAGQPDQSHQLFPSNDHPSDMASYTISMTRPAGWTAVANGRHVRDKTRGATVTSTYREAKPMASELIQLAVGAFTVQTRPAVGGVPIRDVVPTRLAAELLPKIEVERSQLSWMTGKVGRYPFEEYGSLIIDADLGFALETQTLSLYDTGLFGLPSYILDPIMTHELAHMWFGDSVAPVTWSDVWQSEGHATWYELLYADETGQLEDYTGYTSREAYFKDVYTRGDQYRTKYGPVAHPLKADSIWDVFNPNVYDGGALVLYALQQKIGVKKFEALERAWVATNRGKSVGARDFIALASKVSHQDLRGFLNDWLFGTKTPPMPGHPDWTTTAPAPALAKSAPQSAFIRR